MTRIRTPSLILILLVAFSLPVIAEEIATTKDGRQVVLFDDHTWKALDSGTVDDLSAARKMLRPGVKATATETQTAAEMRAQGWYYTMPQPKSAKAAWGVRDGRTTWYNGSWQNQKTGQYYNATPKKTTSGLYLGDNQNSSGTWRNGGSPATPDVFMFLLSESGGPGF